MKSLIRKSVEKMTGYVPGEQPTKDGIIKLNTNENPYPPSPMVAEALSAFGSKKLRLYPDPVSEELRGKTACVHGCGTSNVFVGNGSDEVLALCTRAFVEDDGSIGYFIPSYSLYPVLADIRDVTKKPVELGSDFEWTMPGNYDCSLFFLANPNAPTGILYSKRKIRAFCEVFSGIVVIDEAYVDFSKEDCMDLALDLNNVLVARTLSKSYSLAGLRVGYAIGPSDLIDALYKIKDSYNLNVLSQKLALAALSDINHMRENAEKIRATRGRLSKALQSAGCTVYPSEANFLWVRPTRISANELFNQLREQHILVRHFLGERTDDFVRITIGTDEEIDKLIDVVNEIVT